jgi:predicted dehydrogenase
MATRMWMMLVLALAASWSPGAPPKPLAQGPEGDVPRDVKLMTLDPGHFHAALVQKSMYDGVDPRVHVFAPSGPDVQDHLARIDAFNRRADEPTAWVEVVYTGDDFLEKMLAERPGNVVVLSGNNARKAEYIRQAVATGLNVLADKPMVIRPEEFPVLEEALGTAGANGVVLYDIMTERYEITSILQKRLSHIPALFGELAPGSPTEPAITKESVHHFSKLVSGRPLTRPAWFFDVRQQGEGLVDVGTHLIDLVNWQCFPGQGIDYRRDIEVQSARRWATELTPRQFEQVTGLREYPPYLAPDVGPGSVVRVYANGEVSYRVKQIHARVSVEWHFSAPEGAGDTHHSIMRGSRATLVVRQGEEEGYRPTLYVQPSEGVDGAALEADLQQAVSILAKDYPGVAIAPAAPGWRIVIPDEYKVGHEAHFAQVMRQYFRYLEAGAVPAEEVQDMLAKYYVTTRAYQLSRPDPR